MGLLDKFPRPRICPDVETHWVRDMGGRCVCPTEGNRGRWQVTDM